MHTNLNSKTILITFFLGISLLANAQETASSIPLIPKSQLYFSYGSTMPGSSTKNAFLTNSSGVALDYSMPLTKKGWGSNGNWFGLNIGGQYYFGGSGNPTVTLPGAFAIAGQTSSSVAYKGGDPAQEGFRIGFGPQVNFNLGDKFIISPMVIGEYFLMTQKELSAVQTTTANGQTKETNLWMLPENKTSGLALTPKIRLQYMLTKSLGLFADASYTIGPKVKTQMSILDPLGNPQAPGNTYEQKQLDFGTYIKRETISTSYNALGFNLGFSLAFEPRKAIDRVAEKTKINKANINKSRSNIKQQIDGKPVSNDSTSTEPAKANINKSRSNIKKQIDGKPVTNDSTSSEPAKANINKSRSNIKQQIDGKPVSNDSTNTEPAKANINKSRSNIKQQIDGKPVTNDSTGTELLHPKKAASGLATGRRQHRPKTLIENNQDSSVNPAKANINKSRSNIKKQIDGKPVTNDTTRSEPAKAKINKSRSNIKQQIDGKPVTNDSTSLELLHPKKPGSGGLATGRRKHTPIKLIENNQDSSANPAKANINKSRSNIKQQIDGKPLTNDSTSAEPAKANINKSRSNIKQQIDGKPVTNDSTSTKLQIKKKNLKNNYNVRLILIQQISIKLLSTLKRNEVYTFIGIGTILTVINFDKSKLLKACLKRN